MKMTRNGKLMRVTILLALAAGASWAGSDTAWGQNADPVGTEASAAKQRGFADFLTAGGVVGYALLALSLVGMGLAIDSFINLKAAKVMPPAVTGELEDLAHKGRFSQMVTLCRANDSLICRVVGDSLAHGTFGLPAVRQTMQENGLREITKITHRVNYLGFIGAIAPMMGLLGTVIGMISSFNVLGSSKGSARPDELASGISFALVTTCEGLVLGIPMMFFHNYFRDRVARLGQECSGLCERLLRLMAVGMSLTRSSTQPAAPAAAAPADQGARP